MKNILDILNTETFWYISTLNLCVIGGLYILARPLLKVRDLDKEDFWRDKE